MKRTRSAVIAAGLVLVVGTTAQAVVLYSETFNLGQTVSDAGWSSDCWGQTNPAASISIVADTLPGHNPANGYAFLNDFDVYWSGALAFHTTETINISTASPLTIGWDMMPIYDGWRAQHHLAVQVGGNWYMSTTNLIPPAFEVTWYTLSMAYNPAATNWKELTLNPATHDATVGLTPGADLSGNITGVGIAWTPGQSRFQIGIDNFLVVGEGAPLVPGDANGIVDTQDFTILKSNFGVTSGATWGMGDFTGDGIVDTQDFTILKAHFGQTQGADVPEPATLALLVIGGIGLVRKKRKDGIAC